MVTFVDLQNTDWGYNMFEMIIEGLSELGVKPKDVLADHAYMWSGKDGIYWY